MNEYSDFLDTVIGNISSSGNSVNNVPDGRIVLVNPILNIILSLLPVNSFAEIAMNILTP